MASPVVSLTCTFGSFVSKHESQVVNRKFEIYFATYDLRLLNQKYKGATQRKCHSNSKARLIKNKNMNANRLIFFLGIIILFASCSATKSLTDDQLLYRGAKIKIESSNQKLSKNAKNDFQDELEALARAKTQFKNFGTACETVDLQCF